MWQRRCNMVRRLVLALMVLGLAAGAAVPPVRADEACCRIAAIDARAGRVTVQEKATGRTFHCKVTDASKLKHLRVGQPVRHNYFSGKVLSAGDLTKEQEYHRDQRRLHPATPKLDRPEPGKAVGPVGRAADCPPGMTEGCPPRCP